VPATPPSSRWFLSFVATWLCLFASGWLHAAEARKNVFIPTPVEREWLGAHPKIRVGFDPAWLPFSAVDAQRGCVGLDADLLAMFSRELGVTFEFVPHRTWVEAFAAAQRGEVDMLVGTALTAERARDFIFSEPYFSFPVVIVTRTDEPLLWSVLDLAGRKIAGVQNYAPTLELMRTYPSLNFRPVETVAAALRDVSEGEADAAITNLPNASFITKTQGLTNLKVAGVMPERFSTRYAIRKDWVGLQTILDRAIASLSESDRQALVHPWIKVDYARVVRWDIVWKSGLISLVIVGILLGAVLYHNRCLQRELRERIRLQREVEDAHNELVRLNEEKSELLQVAAHDLRGPLTGMQLVIDSSLRLNAVPGPEALRMVEKQMRQMAALLNDVLDVEALESGRREFAPELLNPAESARASVARLSPSALSKGIRLDFSGADSLPMVKSDRTAFAQITDNLISNAIKFSPRESTVTVSLRVWNEFVRLEVRDQGPGVPADETEKIFAKYARGSARPTGGEKSTGLGLSIVRQLAGAMNGRVWCEAPRTEGKGAMFIFVLPACGEWAAGDAAAATD
jgi:signal transduction histidine kinase